jgi:hypothetical protein
MGRQHQRRGAVGENKHWQKEIVVLWEELYRKVTELLQHKWTAAELNIRPEDSVSTKTVRRELHKSSIHGRAATAKLLITKSNAEMRTRCCLDHKTCTSDNWKRARGVVRWVVLHAVPHIRKTLLTVGEAPIRNPWVQQWNTSGGRFCEGLGSNIVVFWWSHYYPSWLNYCKGVCGQVG